MTLIVEDGSQVSNANSYVSDSDYTTYAAARGRTIGTSAANREIELIKAMDYIESHRDRFKGDKKSQSQALQWPRYNVELDGYAVDSDSIPQELKNAQMEAAILLNGSELLKTGSYQNVQREKLGELEVSYFSGGSYDLPRTDTIDVYLDLLLSASGSKINAPVFRA
jgi:hypothetical protein